MIHSPTCCRFRLPDGLRLEHLEGLAQRHKDTTPKDTPFLKVFGSHVDDSQTWDFVAWMRSVTSLPIFVKVCGAPAWSTNLYIHAKHPEPLDKTTSVGSWPSDLPVCSRHSAS